MRANSAGSAASPATVSNNLCAGHLAILDQARRARARERFRIAQLVLIGGERKRRKDGRLARRRQFGDRARARPAHHQVGLREGRRHVGDEWQHFALQAGLGEGRAQLVASGGPL